MEMVARTGDKEVARSMQESLPELLERLTGESGSSDSAARPDGDRGGPGDGSEDSNGDVAPEAGQEERFPLDRRDPEGRERSFSGSDGKEGGAQAREQRKDRDSNGSWPREDAARGRDPAGTPRRPKAVAAEAWRNAWRDSFAVAAV